MLWALISTLFDSLSSITWKVALDLSYSLSAYGFKLFGMFGPILFVPYFLIVDGFSFNKSQALPFLCVIGICIIGILGTNMSQYIYKREKISVLMPYENLNKVFTIIASFFILSDGKIGTLLAAFGVLIILIITSIDFKKFTLPSLFSLVFLYQFLVAVRTFWIAYLIKVSLSYNDYFIMESFVLSAIIIAGVFYYRDIKKFTTLSKQFYSYRLTSGFIGTISYIIGLYLLSSLGLMVSILLSFLGIVVKLILTRTMLKEQIKIKDVTIAGIVTLLVGVGFIFR